MSDPGDVPAADVLRTAYREQLLGIAALDLTSPDPLVTLPDTAAALADLAQAALEAALVVARAEVGPAADRTRLAVIAMGKTGGCELNYISDVDVIFVAEPADGVPEEESTAVATDLATRLMRICSASTPAGSLWQVDPALRPEGKNGPLVRTVASHRTYYERWAKTWEFQALLKARPVAGDGEVGRAYCEAVQPLVWQASSRENFVDDVQAMRRRVEQHIRPAEADRQLKLGAGGLRDVEFSVQLLQLVHGRADESLRTGTTLDGLAALSAGGYVGRDDAATLATAYRLLRTLEHRIQLFRLRRTHLMPTAESDLRRLGRALGHRSSPAEAVVAQWRAQQREVRRLHERIFYRPLLSAVARLSDSDVRLTPEAARERLSALGFRDTGGALRHLEALTGGLSRRASIQRQLLPVMLGWFADEADPDAGLLAFRKISDELGSTHWYLRLLRDEGSAAERLAHTLARSRFAADLLEQAPECVQFLGDASGLRPRHREDVLRRMRSAAGRKDDARSAVLAARTIRRSELFRVAVADLTGSLTLDALGTAMTDLTAALLEVTLEVCLRDLEDRTGAPPLTRLLVVGMGRLGGGEQGYGSDADVVFVHDPVEGADEAAAQTQALEVVKELIRLLGLRGPDPNLDVDASLRPEGKSGPLVRSLASYREYYARWSLVWEAQALLRATPVAGDPGLAERYLELVAPIRWPEGGLTAGPGPRDPHPQGADGVRAAAPRCRPQDPLQARSRRPLGRRVGRPARPADARLRARRSPDDVDDGCARGGRAAGAGLRRARRGPRRRMAPRVVDAQRGGPVPGEGAGCRADRPAGRRRHRAHPRAARRLGAGPRRALPAGRPAGPRRLRGRVLRRLTGRPRASIAEHPDGAGLSAVDRAVYAFAVKVAADASSVEQADVDALRAAGLSDADVADVVFAVAARCFFTAVLDGLGAQLDVQTAQTFAPAVLESMVVGRPVAGT